MRFERMNIWQCGCVAVLAASLCGCYGYPGYANQQPVVRNSAGVVIPVGKYNDALTLDQIRSARKLETASSQLNAMMEIAAGAHLSKRAQVELARGAFGMKENKDKVKVLLALIGRTDFNQTTKGYILRNIDALQYDSAKQRVVLALQDKS